MSFSAGRLDAYINLDIIIKRLEFLGDSRTRLRRFPDGARSDAGFQLQRVQLGYDPADWKPMTTIGQGVREIRVRDATGAFRVIYIASFGEAVYVLHAFQKGSPRTSRLDLAVAQQRFRELRRSRSQ